MYGTQQVMLHLALLVYPTTAFLSRSSITLGLPPLPGHLLSVPAIVQDILATLTFESMVGIFGDHNEGASFTFVFLFISDVLLTGSSTVLIQKLQDSGQDQVRTGTQQKDSGGTPQREDSSDAIRKGLQEVTHICLDVLQVLMMGRVPQPSYSMKRIIGRSQDSVHRKMVKGRRTEH
ncbi:hypothetical protein L227DRAFT_618106 [Lentinus tigrinus ALCF2SS1-6]|uniref:Uncharacterized protein n=1 Tax=Lentinus tigrinus ALCF2SS1-6 TaxID=1328759 RepID=A0A5C2RPF5_9APHY|nr:hypothetical protein L227DRAFT_618106 [Lentinus tigrinus ALCF2SS1-6]